MTAMIEVQGLGKRYRLGGQAGALRDFRRSLARALARPFRRGGRAGDGEFWALRDVSFEVKRGEVLGVIGRNGAGKSTLLKILSRITRPTEGRARLYGRVGSLLEVGTGFHPELTGRENVYFSGAVLGMREAEIRAKFDEIVEFSGVEKFLDTPVKHYSSGMRVRLGFAVAAHLDPEILLVDEVLAVGDAAFQKKCLGKMRDVAVGGRTVLFVSHNMGAVGRLCDRALLLNGGRIEAEGESGEVVDRYLAAQAPATESVVNLADVERVGDLGRGIRFTRCEIRNSERRNVNTLKFGEPFQLLFEARLRRQSLLPDLNIVVGVDDVNAARIATCCSIDRGLPFEARCGIPLKVSASFDRLHLAPGMYYVTVVVRSERVPLDRVPQCLQFEVLAVPHSDERICGFLAGYLRMFPRWEEVVE